MAVECGQTEIWEQRSGHNCPRGWSGASTAAAASGSTAAVGRQHQVHPDERPQHQVSPESSLFTQSSPSPSQLARLEVSLPFSSKNLLFQWGLGQTSPALPNGQGQLRYPPQRTRGTFGREKGTISAGGAQGRRRSSRRLGRSRTPN